MTKKTKRTSRPIIEGETLQVFEIGNITFLEAGTMYDYVEAHNLDIGCDVTMRNVRLGVAGNKHFVGVQPYEPQPA